MNGFTIISRQIYQAALRLDYFPYQRKSSSSPKHIRCITAQSAQISSTASAAVIRKKSISEYPSVTSSTISYKISHIIKELQAQTLPELQSTITAKRNLLWRNLELTPRPFLQYTDDASPPQLQYCTTLVESQAGLNLIKSATVVGFDIEWRVTYKKGASTRPVALVQVCTDSHVILFHVCHMDQGIPDDLRDLITSKSCIKTGLNIKGDAQRLDKNFDVKMASYCELSDLAKAVFPEKFKGMRISLQLLVEALFNKTLDKSSVRTSNWEELPLSESQIAYAANDAYASFVIHRYLMEARSKIPDYESAIPIKLQNLADHEVPRKELKKRALKKNFLNLSYLNAYRY